MEEEEQGFEIDPDMAAQMGFANFGTQPNTKKRKYIHNDAFVDRSITTVPERKTGANNTELGVRGSKAAPPADHVCSLSPSSCSRSTTDNRQARIYEPAGPAQQQPVDGPSFLAEIEKKTIADLNSSDLDRLAKGVRTPNGDMAYFKPSFIGNPWEHLKTKGGG